MPRVPKLIERGTVSSSASASSPVASTAFSGTASISPYASPASFSSGGFQYKLDTPVWAASSATAEPAACYWQCDGSVASAEPGFDPGCIKQLGSSA